MLHQIFTYIKLACNESFWESTFTIEECREQYLFPLIRERKPQKIVIHCNNIGEEDKKKSTSKRFG